MEEIKKSNTAVILPVYKSEKHLQSLVDDLKNFFPVSQIIAIDDGSSDGSAAICRQLGLILIQLAKNQGKGAALQAGLRKAAEEGFFYAFCLDSDEQHSPSHIPDFMHKQKESSAALVLGYRNLHFRYMPIARICSNRLTSFLVSITVGKWIKDSQCGYRLYYLPLLQGITFTTRRYQFETEILLKLAKKKVIIAQVPVKTLYGEEKSHIKHGRDILNFVILLIKSWLGKDQAKS